MLPPYIIEKLRERERAEREQREQPRLEIEAPVRRHQPEPTAEDEERGIVEIPIWGF